MFNALTPTQQQVNTAFACITAGVKGVGNTDILIQTAGQYN